MPKNCHLDAFWPGNLVQIIQRIKYCDHIGTVMALLLTVLLSIYTYTVSGLGIGKTVLPD